MTSVLELVGEGKNRLYQLRVQDAVSCEWGLMGTLRSPEEVYYRVKAS